MIDLQIRFSPNISMEISKRPPHVHTCQAVRECRFYHLFINVTTSRSVCGLLLHHLKGEIFVWATALHL